MMYFSSGCSHGSGVLRLHIFMTNLFRNGIVLEYVLYTVHCSFERNYARNVQSKHRGPELFFLQIHM